MKNSFFAVAILLAIPMSDAHAAVENTPVSFQDIPQVMVKFDNAPEYQKKALTYGRLPHDVEIGRVLVTYIADEEGKPEIETKNIVTEQIVIARNPEPVSGAVYNEWLVPQEQWALTYGEVPMFDRFMPFQRVKSIKAILITDEILALLGSEDGNTAVIDVEWTEQGMTVYKDGYLVDAGYGIAPDEMKKTYKLIENE
ncbi:hypothetical protein L4D09_04080 [Photobacterium makurazakiensis]|uniref:hypothetical protein n=1 Tax=Photobacterium makurazakiensis TaxID=2910234 RepID=UPI003D0AA3EE